MKLVGLREIQNGFSFLNFKFKFAKKLFLYSHLYGKSSFGLQKTPFSLFMF